MHRAAEGSNVRIIDKVYRPDEVLSLMDACDAYVSLHRSEGLGLTMAEAMLMGKPVVATGYSGNVDFMNDSNSLLVPYQLVTLGREIPPYAAHFEWAEPSSMRRDGCDSCSMTRNGRMTSVPEGRPARRSACRWRRLAARRRQGCPRFGHQGPAALNLDFDDE